MIAKNVDTLITVLCFRSQSPRFALAAFCCRYEQNSKTSINTNFLIDTLKKNNRSLQPEHKTKIITINCTEVHLTITVIYLLTNSDRKYHEKTNLSFYGTLHIPFKAQNDQLVN